MTDSGLDLLGVQVQRAALDLGGGEQVGGDAVEHPGLPGHRRHQPLTLGVGHLVAGLGDRLRDAAEDGDRAADLVGGRRDRRRRMPMSSDEESR